MFQRIRQLGAAALLLAFASTANAELKIGVSLSLTGPLSSLGLPQKASLALWPERIAGESVKLIVLDDASDTTGAVKNARRFVSQERVDVILGSSGVPGVFAIAPVALEARTVQLALAPAPRPGGANDWTFPLAQPVPLMSDAVAARMVSDKVRKVAFLGWSEGYGEMWLQAFTASARKAGLEIVATERFAPVDTSITALVDVQLMTVWSYEPLKISQQQYSMSSSDSPMQMRLPVGPSLPTSMSVPRCPLSRRATTK